MFAEISIDSRAMKNLKKKIVTPRAKREAEEHLTSEEQLSNRSV
jgi:hypothetical protein